MPNIQRITKQGRCGCAQVQMLLRPTETSQRGYLRVDEDRDLFDLPSGWWSCWPFGVVMKLRH